MSRDSVQNLLYKNIKIEDYIEIMDSNVVTVGKQLFIVIEPTFMDLPHPTDINQVYYLNCSLLSGSSQGKRKILYLWRNCVSYNNGIANSFGNALLHILIHP